MTVKLAVLAMFKNEADILEEWLHHYIAEGVGRFYLVNNDSTDHFQEVLDRFDSQVVQCVTDNRKHAQVSIYNDQLQRIRADAWSPEWLLVCDLDEFLYASAGTISSVLSELPDHVAQVHIRWLMFGSSGHQAQPSGGVVENFTHRARYPNVTQEHFFHKSLVRLHAVLQLHVHEHTLNSERPWSSIRIDTDTEDSIKTALLRLNHYCILSWQRFQRIKMTRGDVNNAMYDHFRDRSYFESYDVNDVLDTSLRTKRNHKSTVIPDDT